MSYTESPEVSSTLEGGVGHVIARRKQLMLSAWDCILSGPKIRCFTKSSTEDPVPARGDLAGLTTTMRFV